MVKVDDDGTVEFDECKGDGSCGRCHQEDESVKTTPVWERYIAKDTKPIADYSYLEVEESALNTQQGGDHYKNHEIQPIEFIHKNKLSFLEGCIVKRICRYKKKGDPRGDLEKIKHEVDLLIELEGL